MSKLDIMLEGALPDEQAAAPDADPSTLVRAARDFADKVPEYAMAVGPLAVKSLLAGRGYELRLSDAAGAVRHTIAVAASISATDWAHQQIDLALQQPVSRAARSSTPARRRS